MKKITLLLEPVELKLFVDNDIGFLFECAPDFSVHNKNAIRIEQLLQNQVHVRQLACNMVNRMLVKEPRFRGIPQLTIFQEAASAELQKIFNIIYLHNVLLNHGYQECEFFTASWWGIELKKLSELIGSSLKVQLPSLAESSRIRRYLTSFLKNSFSLSTLLNHGRNALAHFDCFNRRHLYWPKKKKDKIEKNKPWFYTTAINYTNIGLLYEPYFPDSFCYLVEDPLTGGLPLKNKKRSFVHLYDFASPNFIPSKHEIFVTKTAIVNHVLEVKLNDTEDLARKMLMEGGWWARFLQRFLPQGLFSSAIFENWLERTEPSMLIVGNGGFEDYALYKARDKKNSYYYAAAWGCVGLFPLFGLSSRPIYCSRKILL